MLIDWFTVCAQVLNFLVLVWLMRRFLYKPILNAIDTREKLVAKELADADAMKAEAQKEHDEFQKKNEKFDKHHAAMLHKANDEVKAERAHLLDEAQKAADELTSKRHEALMRDAQSLNKTIRDRTQAQVFDIARKVMGDLASIRLEDAMSDVFIHRLNGN